MSVPKLVYFPFGGRAAAIRNAFKIGKVQFEDAHITYEQFGQNKGAGSYTFGSVPVLELNGVQVTQSNAILRWAGKQANLYPSDAVQALYVDEVLDAVEDGYHIISPTFAEQDVEKRIALRQELANTKIPKWLAGVEKLLARNGNNGWFVGESGTIADLKAHQLFDWLSSGLLDGIPTTILDAFPQVVKSRDQTGAWINAN